MATNGENPANRGRGFGVDPANRDVNDGTFRPGDMAMIVRPFPMRIRVACGGRSGDAPRESVADARSIKTTPSAAKLRLIGRCLFNLSHTE
ncbi:MAG: hypothetical protein IH897_03500 [Planctomycetes bacterium]|nr:hypothetical protein [Planctomycetota bacterium]